MKIVYEDLALAIPETFSEDGFFQLCMANQHLRLESDKNQNILIMSPTGSLSGFYESHLLLELGTWNRRAKLGYTFKCRLYLAQRYRSFARCLLYFERIF